MSTVIYLEPNDIGGDIGRAAGQIVGARAVQKRKDEQAEERQRRTTALVDQLNDEGADSRQALAAAVQSGIFDDPQDSVAFAKFYEESKKGGKPTMTNITVDGENKSVLANEEQLKAINEQNSSSEAILDILGIEGKEASFGHINKDDPKLVYLVDEKTGKDMGTIARDEFGKVNLSPGIVTKETFARQRSLNTEKRAAAKAANSGKEEEESFKPASDAQREAEGNLMATGVEKPTREQINQEVAVQKAIDKYLPRIEKSFNREIKADGSLGAFLNPGDDIKSDLAVSAYPDLVRAGLRPNKAFKAAKDLTNGMTVTAPDATGEMKEVKPRKQLSATPDPANLSRKDEGKVFKEVINGEEVFYIYTGNKEDPFLEVRK